MHNLKMEVDIQGYYWSRISKWGQTRIDARCSCGHILYVGWSESYESWQDVQNSILVAYAIHARSESRV